MHFIIGIIDAYSMSVQSELIPGGQVNAFQSRILEVAQPFARGRTLIREHMFRRGFHFLSLEDIEAVEEGITWERVKKAIRSSTMPLSVESWGHIGRFARRIWAHPGAWGRLIQRGSTEPRSALLALSLIQYMEDCHPFSRGQFLPSHIFEFGIRLGTFIRVSGEKYPTQVLGAAPACFWAFNDCQLSLFEIAGRVSDVDDSHGIGAVPPIHVALMVPTESGSRSGQEFADWFGEKFIGNSAHRDIFISGLNMSLRHGGDKIWDVDNRSPHLSNDIATFVRASLTALYDHLGASRDDVNIVSRWAARNAEIDFDESATPGDRLLLALSISSDDALCRFFDDKLFEALNSLMGSVFHPLKKMIGLPDVDWSEMKRKIASHYAKGIPYPAISFSGNGGIGIRSLTRDEAGKFAEETIDTSRFVLARVDYPGKFAAAMVISWARLVRGDLPVIEFDKMQGGEEGEG
jgi:hypothetical protein